MFIRLTNVRNKKIAVEFEQIEEMEESVDDKGVAFTFIVLRNKEEKRVIETIDNILKQTGAK